MFKYQKTGEMDSEYPFLFCSKTGFWMEIPDDKVNSFENTKRQTPKMTFVFVLRQFSTAFLFLSILLLCHFSLKIKIDFSKKYYRMLLAPEDKFFV